MGVYWGPGGNCGGWTFKSNTLWVYAVFWVQRPFLSPAFRQVFIPQSKTEASHINGVLSLELLHQYGSTVYSAIKKVFIPPEPLHITDIFNSDLMAQKVVNDWKVPWYSVLKCFYK